MTELVALYSRARDTEKNIAAFLHEQPQLRERLGLPDLDDDDAALALHLADAVGRFKKCITELRRDQRGARAERAARKLGETARHGGNLVALEADALLGDLLSDPSVKYIAFDLSERRIVILRHVLHRARLALRRVHGVTAHVDEQGLHLRWRGGRGGLNFMSQRPERAARSLLVDLRSRQPREAHREPVPLANVLAEMAFI